MRKGSMVAALIALAAPAAYASCTWEWMCNGEGSCKQMPVCDSVYDVAPPRPAEPAPVPPPMSIRPRGHMHAMRGLECEEVMRRSASGRWSWDQACYCSDARKARDASEPFANIVRCETPWKESGRGPSPQPSAIGSPQQVGDIRAGGAASPT